MPKDRKETVDKQGGGVIVMVKLGISAKNAWTWTQTMGEVKISHNKLLLVASFYRDPKINLDALNELDLSLNTLNPYKNTRGPKGP